jgi:hypothetical protein
VREKERENEVVCAKVYKVKVHRKNAKRGLGERSISRHKNEVGEYQEKDI